MTVTKPSARKRPAKSMRSGSGSATATLRAADKLHAELLRQCESLMTARAGSRRAADLARLSKIVETYERHRWPL